MAKLQEQLFDLGSMLLEEWGLMMVDQAPQSTGIFDLQKPLYLSYMIFDGVVRGNMMIIAQKPFMQGLTKNLLGLDEGETPEESACQDSLKEMTNVLLGNFLTRAYGEDIPFTLTHPQILSMNGETLSEQLLGSTAIYFMADNNPVSIAFNNK